MKATQIKIVLSVFGESFDTKSLTEVLKIQPTRSWLKGDSIANRGTFKKETNWEYEIGFVECLSLEILTKELLKTFYNKKVVLRDFVNDNLLYIKFFFIIEIVDEHKPSLYFDKIFLNFVNDLNGEIDLDIYVLNK